MHSSAGFVLDGGGGAGLGGCGTTVDPVVLGGSAGPFDEVGVGVGSGESDVEAAELDVRRLDVVLPGCVAEDPPLVRSPVPPASVAGTAEVASAPLFSEGRFGISMTLIWFGWAFCSGSESNPTSTPAAPQATTTAITTAITLQRDFARDSSWSSQPSRMSRSATETSSSSTS
ncbi:hypothetical protein [Amycolatopsis regifaucium]|uniref:Uncharacterized protein n=1 Tax=Amycolatopsis regifaucium TaxID=546365 RepID=A0A154MB32_9PSEU|nr:hypothetical protein [Amycolatopsis regifaucium]KZB81821.1 hypothetical protein AVL48_07585 [Amycolatopsis regifaucium]SFG73122.1 hypothetical protein SAMN04489731_101292 [Amycolatopsis regifaucium]